MAILACDESLPTAPAATSPERGPAVPITPLGTAGLLTARARALPRDAAALVSTEIEHAKGRYRYRRVDGGAALPAVNRDDFLVGEADTPFVRLVLSADRVGDELILETAPAYWHDVIKSGTYGIIVPFDARQEAKTLDGRIAQLVLPPVTAGTPVVPLGALEYEFTKTDVCALAAEKLAKPLCGRELEQEVGWLTIAGMLDTLLIRSGKFTATGDMDITMTVSPGGLTGGSAPVFAPCNRGAYPGCIATPTGAALIDWLRYYAPAIPDGSLPAVRLCVPGLPVRVKAGYWDYSGFLPRWVLPVFEQCRITSNGTLPTIVLPSFDETIARVRPRVTGEMIIEVKGDGKIGLEIPVPSVGAGRAYSIGNDFKAEAKLGLFVGFELEAKNTRAVFRLTVDHAGVSTQRWTPSAGWTGDWESTKADKGLQVLEASRPDTIVLKVRMPILQASAEVCVAIVSCDVDEAGVRSARLTSGGLPMAHGITDIAIGAKAKIAASMLVDAIYTRERINQTPLAEADKIALEGAWDLRLEAGITIPLTGFILPSVPRKFKRDFECCRVPLSDLWFPGRLEVRTSTTGASPDPDGYLVHVRRADTLPVILKAGTQRFGPAFEHGMPLDSAIGVSDTVLFQWPGYCSVMYSDVAIWAAGPVWGGIVEGLRSNGKTIPTYAVALPCPLLIAKYRITVGGVSENCSIPGGNTREVWLSGNDLLLNRKDTTLVTVDVVCSGSDPLGSLTVRTEASAPGSLARDYEILLDGSPLGTIGHSAERTFSALRAAQRTLTVTGGPSNCTQLTARTVTIPAGGTGLVTLTPVCAMPDAPPPPAGTVTVTVATTGASQDADGYEVRIDGASRAALEASGSAAISGFAASTVSVLQLSGIAGNCRATSLNPRSFSLNATAQAITIPTTVACVDLGIDTISGIVESSGGVTGLRQSSGALVNLTGPTRGEVTQLAGHLVRVWGVRTGTTLDIYGYTIESSVGDQRWMGIVLARGAETWLFGHEAIHLVNPPAALAASARALVWVSGTRNATTGNVQPTLFGIIRSAP